jgi:hypothetical protein
MTSHSFPLFFFDILSRICLDRIPITDSIKSIQVTDIHILTIIETKNTMYFREKPSFG